MFEYREGYSFTIGTIAHFFPGYNCLGCWVLKNSALSLRLASRWGSASLQRYRRVTARQLAATKPVNDLGFAAGCEATAVPRRRVLHIVRALPLVRARPLNLKLDCQTT